MAASFNLFGGTRKGPLPAALPLLRPALTVMLGFTACLPAAESPKAAPFLELPPPSAQTATTEAAAAQTDRERLRTLMGQPGSDAAVANALARFLPTMVSKTEPAQAYTLMLRAYAAGLEAKAAPDPQVEATLCADATVKQVPAGTLLSGLYRLATLGARLEQVAACTRVLAPQFPAEAVAVGKLNGTIAYFEQRMESAVAELHVAATTIDPLDDPLLFGRYALALVATRRLPEACASAKRTLALHPLLAEAQQAIEACRTPSIEPAQVVQQLAAERQRQLLAGFRAAVVVAPTMALETDARESLDWVPYAPGKITVLAFFSTWCPHCQKELPRLNQFAAMLGSDAVLQEHVRVIGIRTSVERELEPYDAFIARLMPKFPIYTDATLSLAFSLFCKSYGLKPGLPTIAVLDEAGVARYFLNSGDYHDTVSDVRWAVESLLPPGSTAKK